MGISKSEKVVHEQSMGFYRDVSSFAQKSKLSNWLESTGWFEGEVMGLESESLPIERLEALLESLLGTN